MSAPFYKQPILTGILVILILGLSLSACGPANTPAPSTAMSTPAETQEIAHPVNTPAARENPAETQQEYINEDFGFSLSYPNGYVLEQTFPHSFIFLAPEGTPGERLRGWVEVERNLDQDAEWYFNQAKQEVVNLGAQVSSQVADSMRVVDGQQAYILENMPGQDLNRQVFIVYKGFLYHLFFLPDYPQSGEAYEQMETLYAAVMNSLRFMPERRDVPPILSINNMVYQIERACEGRSEEDITRLLGDTFDLGDWNPKSPEHYGALHSGRNEAARLLLDDYLSQTPDLVPQYQVEWASLLGDPDIFSKLFPGENINRVFMQGWGPQGDDEVVLIINRRMDGSLFWRGVYIAHGQFTPLSSQP